MSLTKRSECKNVPAVNIVCHGSPWEMGHAQGTALKHEIHQVRERLADLEAFRLKQPAWLPYRLYRSESERRADRFLAKALAQSPAWFDRLEGLAAGANLKRKSISLLHALEPLMAAADVELGHAVASGCSAVAVRGQRSATGTPLLARNFDYLPLVQPFYILRRDEPAQGLRSLVFSAAPLAGAVDGMNECGLCITYNYAVVNDAARPAPTISMHIADALAHCRTVEEAAAWLSERPRWGSGILMLADETGDIASLELSHTRCELRRPVGDEDLLFHSNCYQTPAMQSVQVSHAACWSRRAPRALQGIRVLQSAERRDNRLRELLAPQRPFDLEDLARIMGDHGAEDAPSDDTICKHSDYWNTTASLQFVPADRKVRVSYNASCAADYREFEL